MIGPILLALSLVLIGVIALKIYKNIQKAKGIPGVWQVLDNSPCYIPILSPYFYMGSENHLIEVATKRGDPETGTLRITTMNLNRIFVSDREMLKDIHSRKLGFFPKSKTFLEPTEVFGGHIVSAPDTDSWKKHHNTISPAFSSNNLEYMSHVSSETVDTMAQCLWNPDIESKGEHVIDRVDKLFTNLTLDILAKCKFLLFSLENQLCSLFLITIITTSCIWSKFLNLCSKRNGKHK